VDAEVAEAEEETMKGEDVEEVLEVVVNVPRFVFATIVPWGTSLIKRCVEGEHLRLGKVYG